jgi:glutathione S-transferase
MVERRAIALHAERDEDRLRDLARPDGGQARRRGALPRAAKNSTRRCRSRATLSKSKYFAGDEFSLADIGYMPYVDYVFAGKQGDIFDKTRAPRLVEAREQLPELAEGHRQSN